MITPAFAQAAPAGLSSETIIQFVPFILVFVIMWFLVVRPQQRRAEAMRRRLLDTTLTLLARHRPLTPQALAEAEAMTAAAGGCR